MPTADAQQQEAWLNMDTFEKFLADPTAIEQAAQTGVMPLRYKPWYDPTIHRRELIKWCLSDAGREAMAQSPAAEQLVVAYLAEIDMAGAQAAAGIIDAAGVPLNTNPITPSPMGGGGGQPSQQGASGRQQQMRNSNQNAAGAGKSSSSAAGTTQPKVGTVKGA